jgi:hypothetical protein
MVRPISEVTIAIAAGKRIEADAAGEADRNQSREQREFQLGDHFKF